MDASRLTAALDNYTGLKHAVCAEAGGPADCVPVMEVHDAEGHIVVTSPESAWAIPSAIVLAIATLPGDLAGVVYISEAYCIEYATEAEADGAKPGDATAAFQAGDSRAYEQIQALAFDASGDVLGSLAVRIGYDDVGRPTFGPAEERTIFGGAVPDAVRWALSS